MSAINHTLRQRFSKIHAQNCSPEELFRQYDYYYKKYADTLEPGIEGLHNSLWYLSKLLFDYSPEQVIRIVYKAEGSDLATIEKKDEEFLYIYLMRQVAILELYYQQYAYAALWAKKTVELVNYFHPFATEPQKQKVIEANINYLDCQRILQENIKYYDDSFYKINMTFAWERKLFSPLPANENPT
ncbi:hypothetical protein SAMN05444008_13010 [Cnuella takakiae]|uniref:Uncharacterized protein n=1 Tax=Cnuella takakiae TaxID=1302690 RepID=A0A1M5JB45_9BACT|nr:hypothetical protein [Cnuella takakiae]OLY95598.1 hypothetical protein BUE76_00420 [Cnuella takakiae]SHG37788.1 hypothetical protein SAMN05444008_13010 [Cnuella takakiae]